MTGYLLVNNLSKGYKQYKKPVHRLVEWCSFKKIQRHSLLWVLQNINFEILPGESVGIIGVNGAGKSTLLKLITGTTKPTKGSIELRGRVAALLELGMGFHPDFTGRENVFMAGQLLGFNARELQACFSDIEQFADIGNYMDQPVRVYSSGMQVRLAFSVATAIRPDILIVDEALSVGDIYFQQKCYERISQFKKQGTTLLFVSHDLIAVNTICDRTIFIKDSYIAFDGKTDKAIDYYHTDFLIKTQAAPGKIKIEENDTLIFQNTDTNTIDSLQNEAVKLINVELFSDGVSTGSVISDSDVTLSIKLLFLKAFDDPHVGFKIRDRLGVVMFETSSYCMRKIIGTANKNEILTTSFKFKLGLICGEYTVTVGVANKGYAESEFREHLIYVHGVKKFTILKNSNAIVWAGIYNLLPEFSCAREPSIINVT